MGNIKLQIARVFALGTASFALACGSSSSDSGYAAPGPGPATGTGEGATATTGPSGAVGATGSSTLPQSGTLTAGTWDDNRNFDFFTAYRHAQLNPQRGGLLPFADADYEEANQTIGTAPGPRETLDVALVIDTTGSMGDEIRYLQSEFQAIAARIANQHPNSAQRWSLVVYRDQGDEYVVRTRDFVSDLVTFQTNLAAQSASGGGDFPEAPDQALAATTNLAWRTQSATAKLAFWVADAPHHDARAANMAAAITGLRDHGIHLYPVASSGIDEFTELTMRSAAQLTGGRYLFLTDDSGVGNAHKEPSLPCYYVTKLDVAIERMVDIELSGVYREPNASDILRTGGDPKDGACTLASNQVVLAY